MTLYCGIDLHINNHVAVVIDDNDKVVAQRKCSNELSETLSFLEPYRDDLAGAAIESTPNWYWLYDGLKDHGYEPCLVNVLAVKQYDGLKHTDDKDDAFHLAHLMRLGILPIVQVVPRETRWLRDLMRRRSHLVRTQTGFHLVRNNLLARQLGWHGSTKDRPPVDWSHPALSMNWEVTGRLTVALAREIAQIERFIRGELKDDARYEVIRTMPGVGLILAATVVTETGDIGRFKTAGNYASYARLVAAARWSNGKKKASNNRKAGNKYLSWAFHEAAHHACRYQEGARKFYQRKAAKTNRLVAIRALARKLARASFYLLRDEVPYDEGRLFH